jgi:hypothetical protein
MTIAEIYETDMVDVEKVCFNAALSISCYLVLLRSSILFCTLLLAENCGRIFFAVKCQLFSRSFASPGVSGSVNW